MIKRLLHLSLCAWLLLPGGSFAQSFEFLALQSVKEPNDIILSPVGFSGMINNPNSLFAKLEETRASSRLKVSDDVSFWSGHKWAAELSDFGWQQVFNVNDLFIGYLFQVEVKDSTGISSWLVAGVSAVRFLLSKINPLQSLSEYSVADSKLIEVPDTQGEKNSGRSGYPDQRKSLCVVTSDRLGVSRLAKVLPHFLNAGRRDDEPPEEHEQGHSGGNICHHRDCVGRGRCIKAEKMEQSPSMLSDSEEFIDESYTIIDANSPELLTGTFLPGSAECHQDNVQPFINNEQVALPPLSHGVDMGDEGIEVDLGGIRGSLLEYGESFLPGDFDADLPEGSDFSGFQFYSLCENEGSGRTGTANVQAGPESLESQLSAESGVYVNESEPFGLSLLTRHQHIADAAFGIILGTDPSPSYPSEPMDFAVSAEHEMADPSHINALVNPQEVFGDRSFFHGLSVNPPADDMVHVNEGTLSGLSVEEESVASDVDIEAIDDEIAQFAGPSGYVPSTNAQIMHEEELREAEALEGAAAHNVLERKRRDQMKQRFDKLGEVLHLSGRKELTKINTLKRAKEEVERLRKEEEAYQKEVQKEREKRERNIRRYLKAYFEQHGEYPNTLPFR